MPQLELGSFPAQILWLILVFGLFYTFSANFLVPKLQLSLSKRSDLIQKNLHEAELMFKQVQDLKKELEKIDKKAHMDAVEIRSKAMSEAQAQIYNQNVKIDKNIIISLKKADENLNIYKAKLEKEMASIVDDISPQVIKVILNSYN